MTIKELKAWAETQPEDAVVSITSEPKYNLSAVSPEPAETPVEPETPAEPAV